MDQHHDRDYRTCVLGGSGCGRTVSDDDVHVEANEVGGKLWKPVRPSVRESTLKEHIPSGCVAAFLKSLFEAL